MKPHQQFTCAPVDDEEIPYGKYWPGELIEKGGQLVCRECGRVGSLQRGYCLMLPDGETMCREQY